MSPFGNGVFSFISQVEMLKEADATLNYLRAQGYGDDVLRAYQDLKQARYNIANKQYYIQSVGAARKNEEFLRKALGKEDVRGLFHGEGPTAQMFDRGAMRPHVDPKTLASTPGGRAATFEARMLETPGGEERMQHLREKTRAAKQPKFQPTPVGPEDVATQEYMLKHKGKSPTARALRKEMMGGGTGKVRGGPAAPEMDWTWDAGAGERPPKGQPYYGGRGGRGPKIHESPMGAMAGDPATRAAGGAVPIPGPKPGQQAPGTAGVGAKPRGGAPGVPRGAVKAPGKGILGRLKGMGRMGRVGLGVGALALLAGGMMSRKNEQQQQQMQPVYSPLAGGPGYY